LELLKAYLTDPGYRPEALALARRAIPMLYNELHEDVEAPPASEVPRFLASGGYRFGYPTGDAALSASMDDLRSWLAPALNDRLLEISVVGGFDPAQAEADLAATCGPLPPRADRRPDYAAKLKVKFPDSALGSVQTFTVSSASPKAEALDIWPTTD